MKLRNKLTGEIINNNGISFAEGNYKTYNSIAEFNEEWEDYKEPKEHWYIECDGEVYSIERLIGYDSNKLKAIGNYFETEEEAELAVEKLKAWKRLKDKGFRFDNVNGCWIEFTLKSATSDEDYEQGQKDLLLLFGGEE